VATLASDTAEVHPFGTPPKLFRSDPAVNPSEEVLGVAAIGYATLDFAAAELNRLLRAPLVTAPTIEPIEENALTKVLAPVWQPSATACPPATPSLRTWEPMTAISRPAASVPILKAPDASNIF
jgi:hypothetical protein